MGCWNGTCGVSQMSIPSGEKVKCFLLLQSEFSKEVNGAGQCYSTAYFRPWFFPVTAEYNDYGSIQNIEMDWHAKHMLEQFQIWLNDGNVELLGDDSEINSPDIDKFETLENVFDCVERGGIVFKTAQKPQKPSCDSQSLKIGMFMILESVFDTLVTEGKRQITLSSNSYWMEKRKKETKNAKDVIIKVRKDPPIRKIIDDEIGCIEDIRVDRVLGDCIEEHSVYKHYKELLFDVKGPKIDDFFEKLDEAHYICVAMTMLRKYWIPQSGQGSQSEDLGWTCALVKGMKEFIGKRKKKFVKWKAEEARWEKKYKDEQAAKKKVKK